MTTGPFGGVDKFGKSRVYLSSSSTLNRQISNLSVHNRMKVHLIAKIKDSKVFGFKLFVFYFSEWP